MRKELAEVKIGTACGGNQEWLKNPWMRLGGCAAVTACDMSIYLAREFGMLDVYPFLGEEITREEYIRFTNIMKPYLYPRRQGIDTLDIYMEGFSNYLEDCGETRILQKPLSGDCAYPVYQEAVKGQIDAGLPIPCLLLKHKSRNLKDYVWHWFLLCGYEEFEDSFLVKAVSYGTFRWFSLYEIWDSGYDRKGGLVLLELG